MLKLGFPITNAKGEECRKPGDLLSWDEAEWGVHGEAKITTIERIDGPCRKKSQLKFFTKTSWSHVDCMGHCLKLGSHVPPVMTLKQWEILKREASHNDSDIFMLETHDIFLSATVGEVDNDLGRLDHWATDIEAKEGVWRDYYTGEKLGNHTKIENFEDGRCANANFDGETWHWEDLNCNKAYSRMLCPCQRDTATHFPYLLLRGLCPSSHLIGKDYKYIRAVWYTIHQQPSSFSDIFYVGGTSSKISFQKTSSQWVLSDPTVQTRAVSSAHKETFVLGKYNWTIANDDQERHEAAGTSGKNKYRKELKLSGCRQGFKFDYYGQMVLTSDGEFTCNDGQCVRMEERCDQLSDCRDGSDEKGCNLLILGEGYSKNVPPFTKTRTPDKTIVPVPVQVNMTLLQVVNINDEENIIELQFEITMKWKDSRITFNNLKREIFLNALTEEDMNKIWLPLIVYSNTDQKETTRLGWMTEWSTSVTVAREGSFER